jgi:hypothetical protein
MNFVASALPRPPDVIVDEIWGGWASRNGCAVGLVQCRMQPHARRWVTFLPALRSAQWISLLFVAILTSLCANMAYAAVPTAGGGIADTVNGVKRVQEIAW